MELLIVLLVVAAAVAGLIVKAVKERTRQVEDAWNDAARQLGMEFRPGSLMTSKSIHGRMDDNRVEVGTFKRSTGQSSTTYTRYRVYYPETIGLGLRLKQQSFVAETAAFFGGTPRANRRADHIRGTVPELRRPDGQLLRRRRKAGMSLPEEDGHVVIVPGEDTVAMIIALVSGG